MGRKPDTGSALCAGPAWTFYLDADFYSGPIDQAMKLPVDKSPAHVAIGRTSGWLARWQEMLEDRDQMIARPRQLFLGAGERDDVPLAER